MRRGEDHYYRKRVCCVLVEFYEGDKEDFYKIRAIDRIKRSIDQIISLSLSLSL